ncbi:hypothetical protein J6590_073420 [Homalodisca vitripennis]|nr:hypothetical protein J6590_073420 [Homalodisca vitripennis]
MNFEEQRRIMDLLESVSEPNSSELGVNDSDVSDIGENELVRDFEIDSDSEHSFNEELPADSEVEGEPDVEDDQQNLSVPGQIITNPKYSGRDIPNPTIWSDRPQNRPTRIRRRNIVTQLPGPVRNARHAKTELECWMLFYPVEVIENIVTYTNQKISEVRGQYNRERDAREPM